MKNLLTLIALLMGICLPVLTSAQIIALDESTTRAVIIGISVYSDERIPDLRFAHVDAQAFADYLRSPAGGSLPNDQLMLLTNAQATAGKIIAALTWLIQDCKAGDRAIIYFSGHGDVEQVTKFQRGYLLAHDSPGTTYMAGGSLPVGFLSDVITTLSDAGVEVVMVSDACRSGKLAGSVNGGTQATSAALAQQFSKEIKILSCQPEEFSLEGEQWGGGRGCFSFHLIDALTGMADDNADGLVNLLETGRYLEYRVPAETAPHPQIPMTVGNRSTTLSTVQPEALAALRGRRSGKVNTLSPIDARGFEDMVLAKADTSVQQLYDAFTAALERGDLMSPTGASANDYYLRLLPEPGIEKLKGLMTRNLAAALQDEAQVVINQLLRTDPQIVDDAFSPVSKYDHLPGYLHRAGELLGERHYMFRFIKAREFYFKAKACRKENYPELSREGLVNLALSKLDSALFFDSSAAFVYNEKGNLHFWQTAKQGVSLEEFEKALELSPQWVLPLYMAGRVRFNVLGELQKGAEYLNKAIALDSSFLPPYSVQGWVDDEEQQRIWCTKYLQEMNNYKENHAGKVPAIYYNYEGNALIWLGRYEEAKIPLFKAMELSNEQLPQVYRNLGVAYMNLGQYEEAENCFKKNIERTRYAAVESVFLLAELKYFYQNRQAAEAIPWFKKAVELGRTEHLSTLATLYLQTGQLDSAEIAAKSFEATYPDVPESPFLLAKVELQKGNPEAAKVQFHKMESLLPGFDKETKNYWVFYYKTIAAIQLDSLAGRLEQWRKETANDPVFCFEVAKAFGSCHDIPLALDWLELAFKNGWKPPLAFASGTFHTMEFFEVRKSKRFKKLVRKYFPDQVNL